MYNDQTFLFSAIGSKIRKHPCCLCKESSGLVVGAVNYIGLGRYDVLQCEKCGLASFDPMPDASIFSKGYGLYYQHKQQNFTRKQILQRFQRDYRRGGYFARTYLRKYIPNKPLDILEVGAGNGYFSQGVKYTFPGSAITYIDIVEDLCKYYKMHFECSTIAGEFSAALFPQKKYDIVIARDLIEHLTDPHQFMLDVNAVLKPGGLFYFITPNGRENLWMTNQRFIHGKNESLIMINHVHYFLAGVLDRLLEKTGFEKLLGFKWGLKGYKKGLGHRQFTKFPKQKMPSMDSHAPVRLSSDLWKHDPSDITSSRLHGLGVISRLYSSIRDIPYGRCDFYEDKGRQFFVLAQKNEPAAQAC